MFCIISGGLEFDRKRPEPRPLKGQVKVSGGQEKVTSSRSRGHILSEVSTGPTLAITGANTARNE